MPGANELGDEPVFYSTVEVGLNPKDFAGSDAVWNLRKVPHGTASSNLIFRKRLTGLRPKLHHYRLCHYGEQNAFNPMIVSKRQEVFRNALKDVKDSEIKALTTSTLLVKENNPRRLKRRGLAFQHLALLSYGT